MLINGNENGDERKPNPRPIKPIGPIRPALGQALPPQPLPVPQMPSSSASGIFALLAAAGVVGLVINNLINKNKSEEALSDYDEDEDEDETDEDDEEEVEAEELEEANSLGALEETDEDEDEDETDDDEDDEENDEDKKV